MRLSLFLACIFYLCCSVDAYSSHPREYYYSFFNTGWDMEYDEEHEDDDEDYEDPYAIMDSTSLCAECLSTIDEYTRPPSSFYQIDFSSIPSAAPPLGNRWCCRWNEPIYSGYLHCQFDRDWPFLKRQIAYTKNYPDAEPYWVETSKKASDLNALACVLFEDLIENTPMRKVRNSKRLAKAFPFSSWYFWSGAQSKCIAANCFRFSDCWTICQSLSDFGQGYFSAAEASLIDKKLWFILEKLAPYYHDIYQESLKTYFTPVMRDEVLFMQWVFDSHSGAHSTVKKAGTCSRRKSISTHIQRGLVAQLASEFQADGGQLDSRPQPQQPDWFLFDFNLTRGCGLNDQLRYTEAVQALTEAIHLNSQAWRAFAERAYAHFELGNIDLALKDYQEFRRLYDATALAKSKLYVAVSFEPALGEYGKSEWVAYSKGLCSGVTQGLYDGGTEFIPSLYSTVTGLGKGLWSFTCQPVEVSKELIRESTGFIEALMESDQRAELLAQAVPELKSLCDSWPELCPEKRGQQIGYIVGKYGVDILIPLGSARLLHKYRTLRQANAMLTLEQCVVSAEKRATVLEHVAEHKTWRSSMIKDGRVKIHWGRQNKHDKTHSHYITDRSYITLDKDKLQMLVDRHAGKGSRAIGEAPFTAGYKERVDFGEIIGYYIELPSKRAIASDKGMIVHATDGVHVYPINPLSQLK